MDQREQAAERTEDRQQKRHADVHVARPHIAHAAEDSMRLAALAWRNRLNANWRETGWRVG